MLADLQDTIVALSSAPGGGARAIIRLSGPDSKAIALAVFSPAAEMLPQQPCFCEGYLRLPGVNAPLPADLYLWRAPRTYTGQDLVEMHTLSSPPLTDRLIARLLQAGARAAQPGEFTLRAFLAGKLDLTRAEAVLGIINAGSRSELHTALAQLAGGLTQPLQGLREDLLDMLAEVEAGLDFSEEDIRFTDQKELLDRLARALAMLTILQRQLNQRAVIDHPFRVVLVGPPNAGKSSLFNALGGSPAALVSAEPGTTRDYLVRRLVVNGATIELVDTAGWRQALDTIEHQAQALAQEQLRQADLVLICQEVGSRREDDVAVCAGTTEYVHVATKTDLEIAPPACLATSARTGFGLEALRARLAERAWAHAQPALAPSLSRCHHHVERCLGHLRQAHAAVLFEDPAEILALELRAALDELGEMVGAVYTDDLLDRIFSRFCIGK